MSRVKVEIDDELDFDIEDGDMILHIKHDGDIGKVCMPEMNADVKNSIGYHKMLQVLEKSGNEFFYNENMYLDLDGSYKEISN